MKFQFQFPGKNSKCHLKIDTQHSLGNFSRQLTGIDDTSYLFKKQNLTSYANCLYWRQFHEMSNPVP